MSGRTTWPVGIQTPYYLGYWCVEKFAAARFVVEMLDASSQQEHGPLRIYDASTNAQGEVLRSIFFGTLLFVTHIRQPVFVDVKRGSFVLLRHVSIVFERTEQYPAQCYCVC